MKNIVTVALAFMLQVYSRWRFVFGFVTDGAKLGENDKYATDIKKDHILKDNIKLHIIDSTESILGKRVRTLVK